MLDYVVQRDCNLTQIGGKYLSTLDIMKNDLISFPQFLPFSLLIGLLDTKGMVDINNILFFIHQVQYQN